jgi:hypothetical protein
MANETLLRLVSRPLHALLPSAVLLDAAVAAKVVMADTLRRRSWFGELDNRRTIEIMTSLSPIFAIFTFTHWAQYVLLKVRRERDREREWEGGRGREREGERGRERGREGENN